MTTSIDRFRIGLGIGLLLITGVLWAPAKVDAAATPSLACANTLNSVFCGYVQDTSNCVIIDGQQYCRTYGTWRPEE